MSRVIKIAGVHVSLDHYIHGERVASAETFEVISPIDMSVLGQVSRGKEVEVNAAVSAAKNAFPAWADLGPNERAHYLDKLAHIIEERVPDLAIVETTNNGSLHEASLLRVMKRGAHNIHYFSEYAKSLKGAEWDTVHRNAHNKVLYQPAGVTALITPWNAPFMLSTWKVGPALAAGNTVVLKPPEWAPLTCSLLADFAHEAGLPPGVFNVVQGIGEEAGAALVAHPDVKRISFTGSGETAKKIGASAAKNLTPVSFELGGKSPLIVCDDADMDLAVENMLEQYDNAGQVCLAGTRLLIQENVAPMLMERMKEDVKKLKLGDPRDHSTKVGPLIHPEHLKRVEGFVKRAIADGAKLVYGGKVSETLGGLYYEPTLFINAKPGSEILTQEVFGPVLTFQTFKTDEEAIELANNTEYGLAATIFTRDGKRAEKLSSAIQAGLVWVNCFYVRDLAQPFGGMKRSGIGREGGHWSFDFYCDIKNVAHRIGKFG